MRLSKWRPVCPECGYSIRGLRGECCPECGTAFPTAIRVFRRWAVRRLPWDRKHRGGFVSAYIRTLLMIVICPWHAGRTLVLPDNWPRTVRWAGAHLLLAIVAGTLLHNNQYFVWVLKEHIWPSSFKHPYMWAQGYPRVGSLLMWLGQSLVAWTLLLGTIVSLGVLLSLGVPRRHRLAKSSGVKWSLYGSVLPIIVLAAWYGYYAINRPVIQMGPPLGFSFKGLPPSTPIWPFVAVFCVWWAGGMACNPYNGIRGLRAFVGYILLYGSAWLVLSQVLFPAGSLRALL